MLVTSHVLLSKFSCPILPSTVIHREHLLTLLQEAVTGSTSPGKQNQPPTKLVLLCAPAGYGKTTLLTDFAQSSNFSCCWYILDRSDGEPATFLIHLLLSIRQRFPQFGLGLDALMRTLLAPDGVLPRDEAPFDLVIDELAQAMVRDRSEPVALLLCNYHEIHEQPSIKRLMDRLLSQLPAHWTLLLESRALPNLSTTSLLSRREMVGIGTMALRFSAQELQQLVQVLGFSELDKSEAEHVIQVFDGWIMGILLGSHLGNLYLLNPEARDLPILSMASQTMPRDVFPKLSLGEDRLQVFFSLVDQVFQREPRLHAFLAEAAILEEMTPAFCNRLLGIEHADECLHSLEQQGLFVTRSTTLFQTSYTCHPLLRDLFRWRLANESPERFRWLHQRAAELFRIDQHYSQAILHALEAQQPNLAAEVLLSIEKEFLAQGQGTTLAHWIDLLPAPLTSKHPRLQLLRARIHLLLGELDRAHSLLEATAHLVDSLTPGREQGEEDVVHAEIALIRSRALFQVGHYHQTQSLCQQVVERLSVDMGELLAEAHHLLGVCANVQGNVVEGIAHLQKALQFWGRTRVMQQTAELHSVLASSYSLLGNFALADHHGSCASRYWEQLQDGWGRATHLVRLGMVTQRQGNLRVAESLFQEALNHATGPLRFQRAEAYALVSLGELSFEEGRIEQALAQSEQGLALARKVQDQHLMHAALCILALIYGRMKDVQTAWLLLSEAEPVGSTLADYERLISTLTRGTIWLEQGEYQQAEYYLYASRVLATEKGLLREQIQANIRLAASQLGWGRMDEMRQSLDELTLLLAQGSYEHLFQSELQHLPNLLQVVQHSLAYAELRSYLSMEEQAVISTQQHQINTVDSATSVVEALPGIGDARLKVLALGEPLVLRRGEPITRWRMARAMEVCFLLLESAGPLRKEQIITALWPEVNEQTDQAFRSTIYYLKKTLGEDLVLAQSSTYALEKRLIWYDVEAFHNHQAQSQAALAQKNLFVAREELLHMVELYRGDYVQSFYSDWWSLQRDALHQEYLEARHELARICWQLEWIEECITHWQHLLAVDNCLEDAHYGLMRCYFKQGKRDLALRQYRRCVRFLQEELGILPGPRIQKFHQRLLGAGA